MRNPGKYLLAAAIAVSVLIAAPLALGAGEGRPVDGGSRNPSPDARQSYARETQIIASVPTYGTRQSNKSTTGGGAIYGCRAAATSPRTCVRATNLSTGQAFSFSGRGASVGRIEGASAAAKPFTTNAQGVADGLNADRVDSKNAAELTTDAVAAANLFARVGGAAGTLGATRGATAAVRDAPGVYRVTFTANVSACAYAADQIGAVAGQVSLEAPTANEVRVRTYTDTGMPADRDFHLTVTC